MVDTTNTTADWNISCDCGVEAPLAHHLLSFRLASAHRHLVVAIQGCDCNLKMPPPALSPNAASDILGCSSLAAIEHSEPPRYGNVHCGHLHTAHARARFLLTQHTWRACVHGGKSRWPVTAAAEKPLAGGCSRAAGVRSARYRRERGDRGGRVWCSTETDVPRGRVRWEEAPCYSGDRRK